MPRMSRLNTDIYGLRINEKFCNNQRNLRETICKKPVNSTVLIPDTLYLVPLFGYLSISKY